MTSRELDARWPLSRGRYAIPDNAAYLAYLIMVSGVNLDRAGGKAVFPRWQFNPRRWGL